MYSEAKCRRGNSPLGCPIFRLDSNMRAANVSELNKRRHRKGSIARSGQNTVANLATCDKESFIFWGPVKTIV